MPGTYPTQIVQHSGGGPYFENAFPNPAQNQITIPYSLPQGNFKGQIIIYDVSGKEIEKYDVDNSFNNLLLDVSQFPKGTYIYKIFINDKLSESKKFIVN